ncbi:2-oxoadipate dioxygenase/decarboxylase family protein [Rhizosaccharibacter radicis]|uniref:2-oxoadipate dioxygenase/decarboxylase n=1 Tax=Rhizosaccharibacter radicis TaxID=2782605 RepID=A0ABT1W130_9PROT|nr:VOC family protein [Acetobacteraceae bacterium KSS12]
MSDILSPTAPASPSGHDRPDDVLLSPDVLRARFAQAMSDLYRQEVPQYGALLELVGAVNAEQPHPPEERVAVERHGAIRLGTAAELSGMRRLFAAFGMRPVGYYDLSPAGVPVHSTAFRPVTTEALARNPFRVFTSLLRLDLIADPGLRAEAEAILRNRDIFAPGVLATADRAAGAGGLSQREAQDFIQGALHSFRWHDTAPVSGTLYRRLRAAHPLIADVVCFRGPHINHLTPRTLDIDAVQAGMAARGMNPKASIEGPPRRQVPILLRQTSFKALEEPIRFTGGPADDEAGTHTARFGEVEQRGVALTPKGRALYDRLLADAQADGGPGALEKHFAAFPDDAPSLLREELAFFREGDPGRPVTYEDFLPVSAAGIFRSNLGDAAGNDARAASPRREMFVQALGAEPLDEMRLYRIEAEGSTATV